jgi:hypothetical protein
MTMNHPKTNDRCDVSKATPPGQTESADDGLDLDPERPKVGGDAHRDGPADGTAADPLDPASLRLDQGEIGRLQPRKIPTTVPVRNPDKFWFVRVHPADSYSLITAVLDLKELRECYLIAPNMRDELSMDATFAVKQFFTAITRQGDLFLWAVRLPGPDGRTNSWCQSALAAIHHARQRWVRVTANMQVGGYDLQPAAVEPPDPEWPEMSFKEILRIAFRDRFITGPDHPILRQLRGEV